VGSLSCSADIVVGYLFEAFYVVLLVRALLSWIPSLNGSWSGIIYRITEPVIQPVSRVIPPIAGFSLAYIVVFFVTRLLSQYFFGLGYACRAGL